VRLFDACTEAAADVLVNNAGVMFTKPVEVGEEEFDRLFAVNVKGRSLLVEAA
jgi:NAD(P)-dependent dehydrogenase (short-subunit alcohol dehydrogenase family)